MNSSETAFDKLTCLIEDTETLLIKDFTFDTNDFDKLKQIVDEYFDKYEYKSTIVRGITTTISFNELLKNKLSYLKTLLNQCNYMIEKIVIPNVISTDADVILFTKQSILENRIKPILEFVINEIELIIRDVASKNNQNQEYEIDLSDTNGIEKILMLDELGILTFLKKKHPFNLSTNALASAISGITGIKSTTAQSYINPIFSNEVEQRNNPRNSTKALLKVKGKLNELGYNQPK